MKTEYPEKILTTEDVAAYCKVSVRRVRAAIMNREIEYLDFAPPGSKRSKSKRFTQSAVERWLKSVVRGEGPQPII